MRGGAAAAARGPGGHVCTHKDMRVLHVCVRALVCKNQTDTLPPKGKAPWGPVLRAGMRRKPGTQWVQPEMPPLWEGELAGTCNLSPPRSALFCDYYNPHGQCEWHYQPCGAPCLKTCRNPSGLCLMDLPGLEGEDRLLWGGHTSSPQDSTQARGPGAPAAPCPPLGQGGRDGGAATAHDAWLET